MRVAILLAAASLVGCAAPRPTVSVEQAIPNASSMDLCEAHFYAPQQYAPAINAEVVRRGLNCQELLPAITANRAQQDAKRAAAAQIIMQRNAAQPLIPPLTFQPIGPQSTNCVTQRIGAQLHTTCR